MKSCHMQQWPRLIYQTQLIFVSSRTTAQAPDRHQVPLLHHRPLVPPCCRIRPDLRCVPFFRKSRVRMLASAVLCRSSAGTLCGAGRGPDHFWPSGAAALWCPRQTVLFFFGGGQIWGKVAETLGFVFRPPHQKQGRYSGFPKRWFIYLDHFGPPYVYRHLRFVQPIHLL